MKIVEIKKQINIFDMYSVTDADLHMDADSVVDRCAVAQADSMTDA